MPYDVTLTRGFRDGLPNSSILSVGATSFLEEIVNLQYTVFKGPEYPVIFFMVQITETREFLLELGRRLRAARLERNDTMVLFAERLGVSEGTLRAMERGAPTVQIGVWINALWILDRLDEVRGALEPRESLLERARNQDRPRRQRASRRHR